MIVSKKRYEFAAEKLIGVSCVPTRLVFDRVAMNNGTKLFHEAKRERSPTVLMTSANLRHISN